MTARQAARAARVRPGGTAMKWNLRLAAANRGIWKASELQRMLAERGLVISAGKMSGLRSGDPASIKLSDLDVICAVLGCGVEELLIPEPDKVQQRHQGAGGPGRGRIRIGRTAEGDPAAARRAIASPCLMAGRKASSCADCLAWGCSTGAAAARARSGGTNTPARPGAPAARGSWRSRTATAGCAGSRPATSPGSPEASREARCRSCKTAIACTGISCSSTGCSSAARTGRFTSTAGAVRRSSPRRNLPAARPSAGSRAGCSRAAGTSPGSMRTPALISPIHGWPGRSTWPGAAARPAAGGGDGGSRSAGP